MCRIKSHAVSSSSCMHTSAHHNFQLQGYMQLHGSHAHIWNSQSMGSVKFGCSTSSCIAAELLDHLSICDRIAQFQKVVLQTTEGGIIASTTLSSPLQTHSQVGQGVLPHV